LSYGKLLLVGVSLGSCAAKRNFDFPKFMMIVFSVSWLFHENM